MFYKQAAGAIIVRRKQNSVQYLLLCNLREEWGFPKGGTEEGETIFETARREIKEETGIKKLEFQKGFREQVQYSYSEDDKQFWKTVYYFLAINNGGKVKLSSEHNKYLWLSYQSALKKVIFLTQKEVLKKAQRYLGSGIIKQN